MKRSAINIDTVKFSLTEDDPTRSFDLRALSAQVVEKRDLDTNKVHFQVVNRLAVRGDHKASLCVRTRDFHRRLEIEGSPGHFLFGQNVFTSDDLHGLCLTSLKRLYAAFGLRRSPSIKRKCATGDIQLSRVDLACNFELDSEAQVLNVIDQLKHRFCQENCIFRASRSWVSLCPDDGVLKSIAFYAKGMEMRRKDKFLGKIHHAQMIKSTAPILRVELRLRGELRRLGLENVSSWKRCTAEKVFWTYLDRLRLDKTPVGPLDMGEITKLPARLRSTAALHKLGLSKRDLMAMSSYSTFKRYRVELRKRAIDIDLPNTLDHGLGTIKELLSPDRAITTLPSWIENAGLSPTPLLRADCGT